MQLSKATDWWKAAVSLPPSPCRGSFVHLISWTISKAGTKSTSTRNEASTYDLWEQSLHEMRAWLKLGHRIPIQRYKTLKTNSACNIFWNYLLAMDLPIQHGEATETFRQFRRGHLEQDEKYFLDMKRFTTRKEKYKPLSRLVPWKTWVNSKT